jgi:nickel transport system permease protein
VIQASVLLLAVLFIVTNLVVDTVHIWLDPKLRTGGA